MSSGPGASTRDRAYPEWLRCLFCSLIVVAHCDLSHIPRGATAAAGFCAISIGFACQSDHRNRLPRKALQLFGLWGCWVAIYALLQCVHSILLREPVLSWFQPWMLGSGPAIHLWFLPALGCACLVIGSLPARWMNRSTGLASCVAAIVLWLAMPHLPAWLLVKPLGQWLLGAMLVTASIGVGLLLPKSVPASAGVPAVILLGLALALHVTAIDPTPLHLLGIIATVVLCRIPQPQAPAPVARFAQLTAGIYLVHPAAIVAFDMAGLTGLAAAPLVLVSSAVGVDVLRKTRLRPLFG